MSGEEKKPESKTPVKKAAPARGSWVVLDEAGAVQMVEASQLRAALAALKIKGSIVFWPFGKPRTEVLP